MIDGEDIINEGMRASVNRVEDLLNFDDEDDLEADNFGHLGLLEDDEINTNQ